MILSITDIFPPQGRRSLPRYWPLRCCGPLVQLPCQATNSCASGGNMPVSTDAGTRHTRQSAEDTGHEHLPIAVHCSSVPRPGRFVFIDALRGIAAASVMMFHFYRGSGGHLIMEGTIPSNLDLL